MRQHPGMTLETWEQHGDRFCVQVTGVDDSWYFELSAARAAPAAWTDTPPHASAFLPGQAAVTVRAYHPDEEKPPSAYFDADQPLPFGVLQRFVHLVARSLDQPDCDPAEP